MLRDVTILNDLRDLGGVTGSFVLSSEGQPKLRDLPQLLTDDALSEVGSRIVRLREAFTEEVSNADCVLRFEQHRLTIRQAGQWVLCVLSDDSANLATLQMGLTLAARKLATMTLDDGSPAAIPASPTPVPVESRAPASESRSTLSKLIYRGQRVR